MNPEGRSILICSATTAAIAAAGLPLQAAAVQVSDPVDVHVELRAKPGLVQSRSGEPTRVWRYRGKLLRGNASALEISEDSYLGPIIRLHRGQRVRINFVNGLPESSIHPLARASRA